METVLYADVLFLINFGMDFISLWLTFLVVGQKSSALRLVAASVIGGVYGVLVVVFGTRGVLSFVISIFVSLLMVFIGTAGKLAFSRYIKYTFILWGVGALSGGVVAAICSLGNANAHVFNMHNAPFFVLALAAALCTGIVQLISRATSAKLCTLEIKWFGETSTLDMIVDSGNFAREPVSGAPVIFVKSSSLTGAREREIAFLTSSELSLSDLPQSLMNKVRIVRIKSDGGERCAFCFFPDGITLAAGKQRKHLRAAVVLTTGDDYGGCDGIVPASLLK